MSDGGGGEGHRRRRGGSKPRWWWAGGRSRGRRVSFCTWVRIAGTGFFGGGSGGCVEVRSLDGGPGNCVGGLIIARKTSNEKHSNKKSHRNAWYDGPES